MKKYVLTLLSLLLSAGVFAELSTGEPHSSVIPRTGNRPQAGDFGVYVGASVTQIMDLVNYNRPANNNANDSKYWALPLINLKYYTTDNMEFRIGFQFSSYGETNVVRDGEGSKAKTSRDVNYTRFLPGFAYHFNTNNIVDVYIGAQIPIGFNADASRQSVDQPGMVQSVYDRENLFVIGGGAFIGLQFFVADLPFAIGLEGGYSGQARLGGGHRVTTTTNGVTQVTASAGGMNANGERASATHMDATWGADAALTFTYFFRK